MLNRPSQVLVVEALVVLLVLSTGAAGARAQPMEEVFVLPVGIGRPGQSFDSAAELVERAVREMDIPLVSHHDGRDRFLGHSWAPQQASRTDLEAVAEAARDANEHVAFGRTNAARRRVQDLMTHAESALETLNRQTTTARNVLDACLALVRSALQEEKRDAALSQAMRCRQLVPDLSPSTAAHPANVVGVLAEADNLLRRMRIGKLSVRSEPNQRCSVYVNGRHLGTTPFDLEHAAPGDYRVQVECGRMPGRVHLVRLGEPPAELLVDSDFDAATQTEPRLGLIYATADAARALFVGHAARIGRLIGAADVVVVEALGDELVLTRVQAEHGRVVAFTRIPSTTNISAIRAALTDLGEGRVAHELAAEDAAQLDLSPRTLKPEETLGSDEPERGVIPSRRADQEVEKERTSDEREEAASSRPSGPRRIRRAVGETAVAAGAASFALAAVFARHRHHRGDELRATSWVDPTFALRVRDWENARPAPYVFAAVGAALATAGVVGMSLASEGDSPRWLPAVAGTVGVALATWGGIDVARGTACSTADVMREFCSDDLERRDRGAIVMLSAIPVLTLAALSVLRRVRSGRSAKQTSRYALSEPHVQQRLVPPLGVQVQW
jgi:hypothetical protein